MAMTPAIDVLLDVRALLARPGGWIQGTDRAPREEGGSAYCIQGALEAVEGLTYGSLRATHRIRDVVGPIPSFNDSSTTTQDDVLNVLDRAIAAEWDGAPFTMPPLDLATSPVLHLAEWDLVEAIGITDVIEALDSGNQFPPAA